MKSPGLMHRLRRAMYALRSDEHMIREAREEIDRMRPLIEEAFATRATGEVDDRD